MTWKSKSVIDTGKQLPWQSTCFPLLGKNSFFLRVVRCRSLAEEYSVDSVNKEEISEFGLRLALVFSPAVDFSMTFSCFSRPCLTTVSQCENWKHVHLIASAPVCPQLRAWTIQTARWFSTSCFVPSIASISSTPDTQVQRYFPLRN